MKYFFLFILLVAAGYFAVKELKPKPPAPPPPPPPILSKFDTIRPLLSPEDEKKIVASTEDLNEDVRWQALKLLSASGSQYALPLLAQHLGRDPSVTLRTEILDLLSKYKNNNDALKDVAAALKDYNPEIRLAALKALDTMNAFSAAPDIAALSEDPDDSVRRQALATLNDLQKSKRKEIDAACAEWKKEVEQYHEQQRGQGLASLESSGPSEPAECAGPMVK